MDCCLLSQYFYSCNSVRLPGLFMRVCYEHAKVGTSLPGHTHLISVCVAEEILLPPATILCINLQGGLGPMNIPWWVLRAQFLEVITAALSLRVLQSILCPKSQFHTVPTCVFQHLHSFFVCLLGIELHTCWSAILPLYRLLQLSEVFCIPSASMTFPELWRGSDVSVPFMTGHLMATYVFDQLGDYVVPAELRYFIQYFSILPIFLKVSFLWQNKILLCVFMPHFYYSSIGRIWK